MVENVVSFVAGDGVDMVTVVNGSVTELSLYVSQLTTQLEKEGGREGGREGGNGGNKE